MRLAAAVLDSFVFWAPIAAADWLRRRWLRMLGALARPLVRCRELRVALAFSITIVAALAGTLTAPSFLLLVGPLLWGVPHLVSDLRYLAIRTGYASRPHLWFVAGPPLLLLAFGGDLIWGFVGTAAVALSARAPVLSRLSAFATLTLAGASMMAFGHHAEVIFAHIHNVLAVVIWWTWRKRSGRAHWIPLALLLAAASWLSTAPLSWWDGPTIWLGTHARLDLQLSRLAPGFAPELGLRLVLLFCFMQSIHYGIWLHLLPDEDRQRATPPTLRSSHNALRRDLGDVGVLVAAILALGIAGWAIVDLVRANQGYFRLARFHGHLELMAVTLLLLERRGRERGD